jgi:hypothetical protein
MGNRRLNGLALTLLAGAAIGTVGLRTFAETPTVADMAPVAQQNEADDFDDNVLSGVASSPGPIVRTACCIPARDRCVDPMTITECNTARGTLVRHCRFCQQRIVADDGFVFDDGESAETTSPALSPTTVIQLVASFMLP